MAARSSAYRSRDPHSGATRARAGWRSIFLAAVSLSAGARPRRGCSQMDVATSIEIQLPIFVEQFQSQFVGFQAPRGEILLNQSLQPESWFPTPLIDCYSLTSTWLPTESEAPSINPRCARFSFAFPRLRVFPCFAFPAMLLSWRFTFPGDSSFLAVRVSWRFPCPGDSHLAIPNMSWRAVVWSYFNFNSKSVPGCFWCPRAV